MRELSLAGFADVIGAFFDARGPVAARGRVHSDKKTAVWQRWWFAAGLIGMTAILVRFIQRSRATGPVRQLPAEWRQPEQILDPQHALLIESVAERVEALKASRDQPLCR
jgi:hypothetical protein